MDPGAELNIPAGCEQDPDLDALAGKTAIGTSKVAPLSA